MVNNVGLSHVALSVVISLVLVLLILLEYPDAVGLPHLLKLQLLTYYVVVSVADTALSVISSALVANDDRFQQKMSFLQV